MDLLKVTTDLIGFKTETGNMLEIDKCISYVEELFAGTGANVEVFRKSDIAPVIFITNEKTDNYDVAVLGHLDVVPAEDKMFEPYMDENGIFHGRGTLDMKSFAAVAMNSMQHVLKEKPGLKFAVILSTDEEKGSKGTHAFMEAHPNLRADIVLDNDVGGDIGVIVTKCKNPVFLKIVAKGLEAHGSTPWDGIDANEKMLQVLGNIRKIYPYFSKDTGGEPENTWIDTVHFAKVHGDSGAANVIANHAEAVLDFRLVETSSVDDLRKNLDKCMVDGVSYEIVSSSTPVVMKEDDKHILDYKKFAEEILERPIKFVQIGGATDSRAFAVRGSTVIMHSGTGEGMHASNEFVVWKSVEQIADIQIKFLSKLAEK